MSVFARAANRINIAFWGVLETVGFIFKMAGLMSLLAGFISISEQTLNYMRTDYWQPKSLLWAVPDSLLAGIVTVGDLAGMSGQIVSFLAWIPLSLAALLTGVCFFLVGRMLARDR